jgi:hypothetical protein
MVDDLNLLWGRVCRASRLSSELRFAATFAPAVYPSAAPISHYRSCRPADPRLPGDPIEATSRPPRFDTAGVLFSPTLEPIQAECELLHTRAARVLVCRHLSFADAYSILALAAPAFRRGCFILAAVLRGRRVTAIRKKESPARGGASLTWLGNQPRNAGRPIRRLASVGGEV